MDLMARVQGFMVMKQKKLARELAEKYGVPEEEVSDVVESFLKDTYGPAQKLARDICNKERTVLLFIGKKDCNICKRCLPDIEHFLKEHKELEPIMLDYTQAEGLLYHMVQQQEKGMLPLIAMIAQGDIKLFFAGECIGQAAYEKYYHDLNRECSQNLYARSE
jgi:hypothetical protein